MLNISDIPKKRRANAEHWIKIISEHSKSGLSVRKYCQKQKINSSTFYYWFNYLNGKTTAPSSTIHKHKGQEINKINAQKLIALKVAPFQETISIPSKQEMPCVLHFPNGLFLKIYDVNILPSLIRGVI
ncbi:MAG TPA: hypothetical protein VGU44_05615 [Gammaproteobacteria bacterium]|nr:hypothetical protein [Gammaproteobacteria bacterium]